MDSSLHPYMSRASITSNCSRTLSQEGNTDGTHDQSARLTPPQNDTLPPADDGEENSGPLMVQLPMTSETSSSGPPQPSETHTQGYTSDGPPDGGLTAEAQIEVQEDQPSPGEIVDVMKEVLEVLKDSTIASKSGKDNRSRFWGLYKRVAEEHDDEFLERYNSDMDIVLVFSGLFSAVSTSFIVAMESNLSPDPDDTTHALLIQLVQIGLGNFTAAGSTPAAPASTWSPSTANIRIQSVAYASLSFSLLAAFGAVLGKQWLGYYKSQRYGRGSQEERAKRRQEKFDGIVTWYFDAVVQSFPVLLQISLLLFGIALSANMWSRQHTVAWVIIATTVFGFLFYSLMVMAALVSPACPFQTPISTILRMMRIDRVLCPVVKLVFPYAQKSITVVHDVLHRLLGILRSSWTEFYDDHAFAIHSFAWRYLRPLPSALHRIAYWLRSFVLRAPTSVMDPEAQPLDWKRNIVATNQHLNLPDTPTSSLEAPSIKWLLETSTDPEVFLAAASLVPHVDWPLDLDVSDILHQLYDVYMSCLDVQSRIVPSLEEKASACIMALCHLYCGRILREHPTYGSLDERYVDLYVFKWILGSTKVNDNVLAATTKLVIAKNQSRSWWSSPKFGACPDSVLDWLSHTLPFHFVIGRVDKDVEELAMTVISKLLCSRSSPSPQIIANCTLLACVMVGVQFDEKDIVRVDKSSALPQLAQSLWAQVDKVLWTSDGDDLDSAVRRAWHFDIIFRVLDRDLPDLLPPSEMWNLGVCRKIYSRARSYEQNDRDSSASLAKVQRFRFTIHANGVHPVDPAWLWQHHISWQGNSHSPEDFDWLVDYLGDVCFDDQETAGDILVLLNSMSVSCSPAKQHLYIEKLIACMGSSMPPRLRHAALRAAHNSREALASIDVDDADIVLTNLSPAILTAVCPQPGATSADDDSDHGDRDLCYLELVFALARNSIWHPHLFGDGHIDRCSSIIAQSCDFKIVGHFQPHTFYLAGIFLRMTSDQVSATPLSSITEQHWWDLMRKAWHSAFLTIDNTHSVEFLPVLVEGTKKYMCIALKSELERLISDVDDLIEMLEGRGLLEQREGLAAAMKELRGIVKDMLEKFRS